MKVIYAGIFLTAASKTRLMGFADGYFADQGGTHEKVHCHHLTLAFKPDKEYVDSLPLGEKVEMKLVSIGNNNEVQACGIEKKGLIAELCKNKQPHITIATAEGVSPVKSNELEFRELNTHIRLEGLVGLYTPQGVVYEEE